MMTSHMRVIRRHSALLTARKLPQYISSSMSHYSLSQADTSSWIRRHIQTVNIDANCQLRCKSNLCSFKLCHMHTIDPLKKFTGSEVCYDQALANYGYKASST